MIKDWHKQKYYINKFYNNKVPETWKINPIVHTLHGRVVVEGITAPKVLRITFGNGAQINMRDIFDFIVYHPDEKREGKANGFVVFEEGDLEKSDIYVQQVANYFARVARQIIAKSPGTLAFSEVSPSSKEYRHMIYKGGEITEIALNQEDAFSISEHTAIEHEKR